MENETIISVMINKDLYLKAKDSCHENGIKIKKFVSEAIQEKLKNDKPKKSK